ncbi:MAG TPA: hypothetical protein EYP61_05045 [Candidatus Latescibacteria bacterium]|nr:hypothetical protein [Candidatus Latescibacterota bacterium]
MAKDEVVDVGSGLELFVDDHLIEVMDGVSLVLHHPTPEEVVMEFDRPWEGNTSGYVTVFKDEDIYRMYYRGSHYDWGSRRVTHEVTCYAESEDGTNWTRPELGLYEFGGSKRNNIVWIGSESHNFTPFRDLNPDCPPEERYKALGVVKGGLRAFASPDGIRWKLIREEPVITKGAFDSQNLAFWDPVRERYVEFHRGSYEGWRHIMTCRSDDFVRWTEPTWLDFGDAPLEHLYTNAVIPYFRAPHILLGFPMRFLPERKKIEEHPMMGVSDGLFMTSRDGLRWRRWGEAFLRPGPQRERWWQRNNMIAWGLVTTRSRLPEAPDVLSIYSNENYYVGPCRLRKFSLRVDGFVSVGAPYSGGEFTTKPFKFEGKRLVLNYSTSAAGSIRVEVQDREGRPIPGFGLEECEELYGDEVEAVVGWKGGTDLGRLARTPVRLRFVLRDADVYSLQFRP